MPNRIIHEKALHSKTLANLSAEAERLFWRLTIVADDQGRFDAFPATVKSNCFPRLVDEIPTKKVTAWLLELSTECCKFYTVEGREYGYFVKWSEYQRIYGNKPKFPQPTADCCSSPQNPALILIPITTPTPITTTTDPSDDGVSEFEEFWKAYPRKIGGKKKALQAWNKATDKPPLVDILQAIEFQKESEQWVKDNGQFIPYPSTWLNQGRWADVTQIKKPSLMEQFLAKGSLNAHGSRTVLSRVADARVSTVGEAVPGSGKPDERRTAGYGANPTRAVL